MNTDYDKAILYMSVSPELLNQYAKHVDNHNNSIVTNSYPNAGFDLFFPENESFVGVESKMVNFRVKCEMRIYNYITNKWVSTGYYMYPRSSLSKTPLMLANHVGIIDSGYRGNLMGAFRMIDPNRTLYVVEKDTRLLQICSSDLRPIMVKIVNESFFLETERGTGGFGSTGL